MPLALTRAAVTAVLDGSLRDAAMDVDPLFGFAVPREAPGVPAEYLRVRESWQDAAAYDAAAARLARELTANFAQFAAAVPASVRDAGPRQG